MKGFVIILFLLIGIIGVEAQSISGSFMHGGMTRNYTVYKPANYNANNNHPLVFNLHGYGSNGTQQALVSEMNAVADTAGFVIVYPEGTLDASFKQFWNANYGATVDDIGFLNDLVDTIAANYSINLSRVYSTGYSNGAIMSNTLACESTNKFAAIAGVAGTMAHTQKASCTPSRQIPVMHIHGTADAVVDYTGSALLIGVDSLISYWVQHNGLSNTPTNTAIPNINVFDLCTAEVFDYGLGTMKPVKLIKITGGTHTWPGSLVQTAAGTNQDFEASIEIWNFFNQFSLPTAVSTIYKEKTIVKLLQNPVQNELVWTCDWEEYTIQIVDLFGRPIIQKHKHNLGQQSLDISNINSGVYITTFSNGIEVRSLKFICQ